MCCLIPLQGPWWKQRARGDSMSYTERKNAPAYESQRRLPRPAHDASTLHRLCQTKSSSQHSTHAVQFGTDRPGAAEGSCSEHTAQGCPGHSHLSSSTCPNTARTALQHSDGPDPNQYLQAVTADNDRRDVVGKGDGVGQVLRRCMVKLAHRDAYVAPLHLPPLFRANRIERGTLEIQNALEFGLQPTSGWLVKDRQGPHGPLTNHKRVLRSITFSTS